MIFLKTKHLILRTWKESDIEPMTVINQDPKVCEFLPKIGDRASTEAMIQRFMKHFQHYGFCLFAVELKSTQEIIGFVGLDTPSFKAHFMPAIEIGWRLASRYWGKGYATEAAKAVLYYAFKELGMDEIISYTTANNKASRRVMEKLGMHHNPNDDFDHPRVEDSSPLKRHVLYRISRSDFLRLNK